MAKRTIEFECPRCKARASASANRIGHSMTCKSCDRKLLIPAASTTNSAFDDLDDADSDDELKFADENSTDQTLHPDSGSDDQQDSEDLSPIALDGISGLANFEETFTLKCKICDSRIYVTPVNIGKTIECPDCFTKIKVPKPKEKKTETTAAHKNPLPDANTLKQKDDINSLDDIGRLEAIEEVDSSFGLAPVMDDLLAPMPEEELNFDAPDEAYEDQAADSSDDDLEVEEIEVIDVIDDIDVDDPFADAGVDSHESANSKAAATRNRIDLDVDNDLDLAGELSLDPELPLPPEVLANAPIQTSDDEQASPEIDDEDEIELIDEAPDIANQRMAFAPKPKTKEKTKTKTKAKAKEKTKAKRKKGKKKPVANDPALAPSTNQEDESEPPPRAHAAKKKKRKTSKEKSSSSDSAAASTDADGFPSFENFNWVEPAKAMVLGGGIPIWAGIAALLMAIGSGIAHQMAMNFNAATGVADASVTQAVFSSAIQFTMGILPFWVGVLLLWLVCSAIFREAVLGRRQVDQFSISAVSELQSTFVGFAFPFFIAGLPMLLFSSMYVTIPFRFFLAAFFLVAAWHNRSAFNILSTEVLSNISNMWAHWKEYLLAVFILSAIGMVGGLLMELPYFIIVWIGSFVGTVIVTAVTLVYAAITGWHCGYVSSSLSDEE